MSKPETGPVAIDIEDSRVDSHEDVQLNPKSDSHSHDHDHSKCKGHHHGGHGNKQNHKHKFGHKHWLQSHGLEIKLFVYGFLVLGWAVVVFKLTEPVEYYVDIVGSNLLVTFLVVMAMVSYYVTTTTRNGNPTKQVPVNATPQTATTCKQCNYWKPERTHHCSACNECVLRMDHHCPWVCNCVGYRNHKSFVLFCLYLGLASLFYDYRTIYFFVVKIGDDSFFDVSSLFLALWLLITLLICPAGLMVFGLGFYHVSLAMNNLTTLEGMGGANMRTPCDSKLTTEKKLTNKYDKGLFVNLFDFFGSTWFFWWYPTVPSTLYKGQYFDQIPVPTPTEILEFIRGKDAGESPEERIMKPKTIAEVDVEGILKIAEDFTKDKHIQFFNIMLEIGKRKDNTFKAPPEPIQMVIERKEEEVKPEEGIKLEKVKSEELKIEQEEEKNEKEENGSRSTGTEKIEKEETEEAVNEKKEEHEEIVSENNNHTAHEEGEIVHVEDGI